MQHVRSCQVAPDDDAPTEGRSESSTPVYAMWRHVVKELDGELMLGLRLGFLQSRAFLNRAFGSKW